MSDSAIYDGFCALVNSFADGLSPALPVSFPGTGFTPPTLASVGEIVPATAGMWLEVVWIPNETENYALEDEGPSLLQGLSQINVCSRPGRGILPSLQLVDQVIAAFDKGTEFGGVRVYRKPWQGPSIPDPERVMVPVTIAWRGFDG